MMITQCDNNGDHTRLQWWWSRKVVMIVKWGLSVYKLSFHSNSCHLLRGSLDWLFFHVDSSPFPLTTLKIWKSTSRLVQWYIDEFDDEFYGSWKLASAEGKRQNISSDCILLLNTGNRTHCLNQHDSPESRPVSLFRPCLVLLCLYLSAAQTSRSCQSRPWCWPWGKYWCQRKTAYTNIYHIRWVRWNWVGVTQHWFFHMLPSWLYATEAFLITCDFVPQISERCCLLD